MTDVPAEIDSILERVRESLTQKLPSRLGETVHNIEIMEVLRRPYSTTTFLAARTGSGVHRFVLKQIVKHPLNPSSISGPDRALAEYETLKKLYPRFAPVEHCSVPRPIALLPEINAFIVEYVDGQMMDRELRYVHYLSNRFRFRELQKHFFHCGCWLRHFQAFNGWQLAGVESLDNVLSHCHHRLRLIEETGNRSCPTAFCKTAANFLERQIAKLGKTQIPVTERHGDFGPWNTIINSKGVTVIDFFSSREGPLPADVLNVLVFLDSIRFGIANSGFRIRKLRERFLAGLGPLPEVPQPLVLLCEAQQRIIRIAGAVLAKSQKVLVRPIRRTESWERFRTLSVNVKWFQMRHQESSLWPR